MKLLIIGLMTVLSFTVKANTKILKSEINFKATGKPAFIKANGSVPLVSADLKVLNGILSGTTKVNLQKLDSGIDLRDEHLKEKYLHTNKYPTAILTFNNQKVSIDGDTSKVKALLNFHGKEKEIELEVELEKENNKLSFLSNFQFLLSDFDVELPSFQGITAADKVKLNVNAEFEL